MAAVVGRRVGRLSHGIKLVAEGAPIPLDDALQAAREAVQNDRMVRGLAVEPDTIWNAVVTLQYDTGTPQPGLYNIWVPAGRRPLEEGNTLDGAIQYLRNRVSNRLEIMEVRQSGIAVQGVREIRLWINAGRMLLARGVEGDGWVEIPDSLRGKGAVVNIQNTDQRCLIWCLCAFMLEQQGRLPAHHLERVSHYQVDEYLQFGRKRVKTGQKTWMDVGLDFKPLDARNVKLADRLLEFERTNDVGVYIYTWEERDYGSGTMLCRPRLCRTPIRLHKFECVVLQHKNHFVWVRNFQALMSCHGTSDKASGANTAMKHCHRCGNHYKTQKLLDKHLESCDPWVLDRPDATRKTYLPQPVKGRAPTIQFKHAYQQHKVPLYIVADCETYREGDSNAHVASFAWTVVGSELYTVPEEFQYRVFVDQEGDSQVGCVVRGLRALITEVYAHAKTMSQAHPHPQLTADEEYEFRCADSCYLCDRPPCEKGLVREHCHWSGRYRGASCQRCNAKAVWKHVPVFFHNFASFDHGPVIRALAELSAEYPDYTLAPINKSSEKMIALRYGPLSFRDSLCLIQGSLGKLIDDFQAGVSDLAKVFHNMATRHPYRHVGLDLLLRKMPFPYNDLTDRSRLLPGYRIPPKSAFRNDIREEDVDEVEWAAWETARQKAGIHDWRGMHDLYLATDVLALADIIEEFRRVMFEVTDGLDLLHNLTLPKASWIGFLKKSGARIELACDEELHEAVEDGIRGGVCLPCQNHAVANDPRTSEHDPAKPDSIIGYWDANSLYSWAMSQPLATRGYKKL